MICFPAGHQIRAYATSVVESYLRSKDVASHETPVCRLTEFGQFFQEKWSKIGVQIWNILCRMLWCQAVPQWTVEMERVDRHHLRLTGLRGRRVTQKSIQGASGHPAVLQPVLVYSLAVSPATIQKSQLLFHCSYIKSVILCDYSPHQGDDCWVVVLKLQTLKCSHSVCLIQSQLLLYIRHE